MKERLKKLLLTVAAIALSASSVAAQDSFFTGKTIRIVVPFSAGGGYDIYSKIIARHMTRHIPGNPIFVVENMTGAGGLIGTNHVYKVAKPDGLTIGATIGTMFLQQLIGKPGIQFDARKYEYIGAPAQDTQLLAVHKRTGIKSVEQWISSQKQIKFGATGPGSANEDLPKIARATAGLPLQIVSGYKGSSLIRIAFNGGEVDGLANAWESFKGTWPQEMKAGDVVILLQLSGKKHRELPSIPLVEELAKTDVDRKLIRAGINNYGATARPYLLPPGTPKDRVETLRKAFNATMQDSGFQAELKKAKLDLDPVDGPTLAESVKEMLDLDPALLPRMKEILK